MFHEWNELRTRRCEEKLQKQISSETFISSCESKNQGEATERADNQDKYRPRESRVSTESEARRWGYVQVWGPNVQLHNSRESSQESHDGSMLSCWYYWTGQIFEATIDECDEEEEEEEEEEID